VAIYLDGADDPDRAADGSLLTDDDFLVPSIRADQTWHLEIDTYGPSSVRLPTESTGGDHITVQPRSIVVLRGATPGAAAPFATRQLAG
jgi:glycogen operon protein